MNAIIKKQAVALVKFAHDEADFDEFKNQIETAIKKFKIGIENFDRFGDVMQVAIDECIKNPPICKPEIPLVIDGVTFHCEYGICDNFAQTNELYDLFEESDTQPLNNWVIEIIIKWQKTEVGSGNSTGFYVSGYKEYKFNEKDGSFVNLYRNPLRLSAMKFHLEAYEQILELMQ